MTSFIQKQVQRISALIVIMAMVFMLFPQKIYAQKSEKWRPKWLASTPQPTNPTYDFVVVSGRGNTVESASEACVSRLMSAEDLRSSVTALVSRSETSRQHQQYNNGKLTETIDKEVVREVTVNGKKITVTANPIDQYWECKHGQYTCYTLFMVAVANVPPVYDQVSFSHYYGARGLVRSLLPGCGQLYKGSKAKGLAIMAGEVACVGGIILTECTRASYANKVIEQPEFAKEYHTKAQNWETGRNICIGAAAALYLYNLIDAAVAKGAKRTIVKPRREIRFSLAPAVLDGETLGLGLAMCF